MTRMPDAPGKHPVTLKCARTRGVIYLTVTTLRTPASLPRLQAGDYVVHMPVGLTVETGLDGMADEMERHQRR